MKSVLKGPIPPHNRYIRIRTEESKKEYKLLTVNELNDLMMDEWRNLTEEEKKPYISAYKEDRDIWVKNLDDVKAIGVDSYLQTIKEKRMQTDVDSEFIEDDVLTIVNHKRNWKKTWTKKRKQESKIKNPYFTNGRKKIKLKLN